MVNDKIVEFRQNSLRIFRELEEKHKSKTCIIVHLGICGASVGAKEVYRLFQELVEKAGLKDEIIVEVAGCLGLCSKEPLVQVKKPGYARVIYSFVDRERAEVIFSQHVRQGVVIHPWLLSSNMEGR